MAYESYPATPGSGGRQVAVQTVSGRDKQVVVLDLGGDSSDAPAEGTIPISAPSAIPISASSPIPVVGVADTRHGQVVLADGTVCLIKQFQQSVPQSSTDLQLVAGVVGKKIRIIALELLCGPNPTAITIRKKPAGAGSAIYPQIEHGASGGTVLPEKPRGYYCETGAGDALVVSTGAGSAHAVAGNYIEVA